MGTPAWRLALRLLLWYSALACALTGVAQNWIRLAGTLLFVCGGSSAFLGFLGFALGVAGLFGKDKPRATAIVGLILGLIGACMFFAFLGVVGNAGA